ncbi:MAG: phytanoyl-CoA dioxygenase family protein [Pseudomonadota bacterium]
MDKALFQKRDLDLHGYCWMRQAVAADDLRRLRDETLKASKPGQRLNASPVFDDLLSAGCALSVSIQSVMPQAQPVRLISFAKSQRKNWALPWHQDRVVAVREKADLPDYLNWTRKDGVWHAEPPIEFLEDMIFARLHFTPSDEENGCLELVPNSHRLGFVPADRADAVAEELGTVQCEAEPGDLLLVRALTLHRSRASRSDLPREALRIDYTAASLPKPLKWALDLRSDAKASD